MSAVRLAMVLCLCAAVLVTVVVDHAADACLGGSRSGCHGGCGGSRNDSPDLDDNWSPVPDGGRDPFVIDPRDLEPDPNRVFEV